MNEEKSILNGKICPYCNKESQLLDSIIFYKKKSFGLVYGCIPCQAYVGLHKSGEALGRLADFELRKWRTLTHAIFDSIWKKNYLSRYGAYRFLARELKLDIDETHIAMFDITQCKKAIQVSQKFLKWKKIALGE